MLIGRGAVLNMERRYYAVENIWNPPLTMRICINDNGVLVPGVYVKAPKRA